MPDILVGATVRAFPEAVYVRSTTTVADISSTSFTSGAPFFPIVDTTFVASTTGRIMLSVGAGMRDNGGTNRIFVSPEVYEGVDETGTLVLDSAGQGREHALISIDSAGDYVHMSRMTFLDGLTPGATHYARLVHRVTGGSSADITVRDLVVMPTW